jgi:hypothetical protein
MVEPFSFCACLVLVKLFCQMLEFCKTVNPNLDNYEADGVSGLSQKPQDRWYLASNIRPGQRLSMTLSHGRRNGREISPLHLQMRPERLERGGFHHVYNPH